MKQVLLPLMRIGIFAFACLHFLSKATNAQVTPDDTVNTQVTQTGDVSEITGGETRGDNLFHSFQEFSVRTGETAAFLNSNDIANIFSRVTGGDISSIDGLIRANGSANLFLINPAGIIFGEGASLNIGGSFYGSSASSILFEDGEFSATDLDNPPLLTINAPIGLGFRDNPQDIVNRSGSVDSTTGQFVSGLQVLEGKNLALIGGDVRFARGAISAPGGRVELGGLNAAGTISFNDDGSFSFPEDVARSDISLSNDALVDVTGTTGGDISLTAGNITIEGDSELQGGAFANTGLPDSQSGDINLQATEAIELDASTIDNGVGTGNAGEIKINATNFSLVNDGLITNSTFGQGNAGNITIDVSEKVSLDIGDIFSNIREEAEGNAGEIKVSANSISLTNGAQIQSSVFDGGQGNGNNVTLNARGGDVTITSNDENGRSGIFTDVETVDNFDSGNIQIDAQGSILLNNGTINNTNAGTGLAGDINLNARAEISIKDSTVAANGNQGRIFIGDSVQPSQVTLEGQRTETEDGFEFSNLVSTGNSNPDDLAGSIFINARDRIDVIGTNIDSETQTTRLDRDPDQLNKNFSTISLAIDGENPLGSINIERSQVDTTNFSTTGLAGFITLDAANEISVKDSEIFVEGNDGAIAIGDTVQPSQVTLEGERTETEDGFEFSNLVSTGNSNPNDLAGRIRINARDRINILGTDIQNSTETTKTTNIDGEEGFNFSRITLNVDAENPLGSINVEQSRINTSNSSTGFAGNVVLNAKAKIEISDSSIFSTGQLGEISLGETSSPEEIKFNNALLTISNRGITVPENEDPQLDAGTISINAINNISVANTDIRTVTERFGNAGSSTIQSENGTVSFDNSNVFSNIEPGGSGDAGDINITANSISLLNGSQLQSSTIAADSEDVDNSIASGNGGDVILNAQENISLSGRDPDPGDDNNSPSAIFTDIEFDTTGNAGNISITAGSLSLNDEAELNTASRGFTFEEQTSDAGTVEINADIIELDGNSVISAQAFNGNSGGNLEINANFVIAYPNDGTGNDLFATSTGGSGGEINLNVENLFGLEEGTAIDDKDANQFINNSNDIDAKSNVMGLDGTVNINTSKIDPLQGATELPTDVVEVRQTREQTCSVNRDTGAANGLVVKGRGGVQPSPDLPLSSQKIIDNDQNAAAEINEAPVSAIAPVHTSQGDIIPAQGAVVTKDGRITLTAYPSNLNTRVPQGSVNCDRLRASKF